MHLVGWVVSLLWSMNLCLLPFALDLFETTMSQKKCLRVVDLISEVLNMFYHVLLYAYCFVHLLTHFQNYESSY